MLRKRLLKLPRRIKRSIQLMADLLLIWLALWLAFVVRLGLEPRIDPLGEYLWLFVFAPLIAIPIFIRLGMYRAVMRYFGNDALENDADLGDEEIFSCDTLTLDQKLTEKYGDKTKQELLRRAEVPKPALGDKFSSKKSNRKDQIDNIKKIILGFYSLTSSYNHSIEIVLCYLACLRKRKSLHHES